MIHKNIKHHLLIWRKNHHFELYQISDSEVLTQIYILTICNLHRKFYPYTLLLWSKSQVVSYMNFERVCWAEKSANLHEFQSVVPGIFHQHYLWGCCQSRYLKLYFCHLKHYKYKYKYSVFLSKKITVLWNPL